MTNKTIDEMMHLIHTIQSGKVVNEYHSMWIDADGHNHWE